MEEWKEYKLKDVATLTTGFPFDGHKYAKEGIRVVRGDNVTIGNLRWDSDKDKRWAEPFERSTEYALHAEDIVIGMDGSRVGRNRAQVKKEDLPLLIAQRVACVRHNELSLQKYLYYQIFSDSFEQYIKAVQTGTSIPHVSLKQIGDFPIVLPSISKQKRIAEILSSLDKKIEVNRRINDNLEQQAQALFKSWFVDFEPFKDGEFVESELGMIPKGWRVEVLGDVCKCILGGTPSRNKEEYWNGNIAWINSGEVNEFRIVKPSEYITEEGLKHSATKLLPKKTTVLAITGATLGQVSLLEIDSCANQSVIGVLENDNIPYEFIYPLINVKITELCSHMTGGAQQHINKNNVEQLNIVLPSENVMTEYKEKTKSIYSQITNCCFESRRLAELRDTLLPRLMSGELRV